MTSRRRNAILAVVLTASIGLGACSSSGATDASAAPDRTTTTGQTTSTSEAARPTTTTAAPEAGDGDLAAFCNGFDELAAGRDPDDPSALDLGDGSPEAVAAAYASQLATVEEIAAVAPAEMVDNAETYAAVIVARADAAAETGANSLSEMDPATRDAFIEAHGAQQAEINELLAYARDHCGDL